MIRSKTDLNSAVTNLLYDLNSNDELTLSIVEAVGRNFELDTISICEEEGITYIYG